MTLYAIYRSYGGENGKGRPPWYTKWSALASFCRAVNLASERGADIKVIFLNDGAIPADRQALMDENGRCITFNGGSNRNSYLRAIALPRVRKWSDDDFVLLAEDDYLWRPDAIAAIAAQAQKTRSQYLAPYGLGTHEADRLLGGRGPSVSGRVNQGTTVGPPVDGILWRRHFSTTSTFVARIASLREDEALLRLCSFSGGDFDLTSCMALQGIPRFRLRDIFHHHPAAPGRGRAHLAARSLFLAVVRIAVDVAAWLRRSSPRVMEAADPPLATHMELNWLADGDWERLAIASAQDRGSEGSTEG